MVADPTAPTASGPDPLSLRLERVIAAPPERVFDAWTTPELLAKWFGPSDAIPLVSAEVDARVGGSYRLELADPSGARHVVFGVYRAVERPRLLSMSWAWESPGWKDRESRVTVEFAPEGDGTRLVLTHVKLLDAEAVTSHGEGWAGGLERLERLGSALASGG